MTTCANGSSQRHYEVVSPTMTSYGYMEPPDPYICWGLYLAPNARTAVVMAVKDPEFSDWVGEQRISDKPPFQGMKASLAVCEHGVCWGCAEDDEHPNCAECARELEGEADG